MHSVLDDRSPAALTAAIEANGADFLVALGRAGGGAECRDADVHWVIGGSPIDYHNAVVWADLSPRRVDEVIAASQACLAMHQVPGTWHVGPSMRPAGLGAALLAHGFADGGADIGMAADLRTLPTTMAAPEALRIEVVDDGERLAVWTATLAEGFGEGEREAAWVGAMYGAIGLSRAGSWRHYLGYLDREPVATASLFLSAGVAGLYFVMTVPTRRRRGIGAAITWAALRDARALGYHVGVLGASEAGYSVYQRLGFREYCRIGLYEWRPPTA